MWARSHWAGCVPDPTAQCVGVAVKEFRGVMARAFEGGRFNVGVNLLLVKGYAGQTVETFILCECDGDRRSDSFVRKRELPLVQVRETSGAVT